MKRKFVKVAIERVSRTDLICVSCGRFRTEWAIVAPGSDEPVAGVHAGCVDKLHVKHARKPKESEVTP